MTNHSNKRSARGPAGSLDWPFYEPGSFLTVLDLKTEQHARLQQLRRHNHYLHDWGIINGLWVVPANQIGRPWAIQVCPGYAIGCCGEEIEVCEPDWIDIRDHLWKRSPDSTGPAYVGIRYTEQNQHFVLAKSKGCGCKEAVYEHSRIQDRFQIDILWDLPEGINDVENFDLCTQQISSCPRCPESPYIFLAQITLPAGEGDPITHNHITSVRLN